MRDKRLETKLRLLTLQLDNWMKLHDFITYGLEGEANHLGRFTQTANRNATLLSNDEVRRLETEWNAVFTKLGVVQGQLKAQRKELAGQTVFAYHLKRLFRRSATAR